MRRRSPRLVQAVQPLEINPLAASAFALLDTHSSLRLVTDAVHEDDALCLALTCRALRDALWAHYPRRWTVVGAIYPRRWMVDAHAGARVRSQGETDRGLSGLT
jgi:hypothetical protein